MEKKLLVLSYDYYIKKWTDLLLKASKSSNKATFLLENKARTILFMLEALFRVTRKNDNTLRGEFWYKEFKLIEDGLGQIDYYKSFEIELNKKKNSEKDLVLYFKQNKIKAIAQLNKDLNNSLWFKNYTVHAASLIKDVTTITKNQNIFDVAKTISKEIDKIEKFITEIKYKDIEHSTHELRRKLRWISIYGVSFRGLFQLRNHTNSRIKLQKYLTEEILASPFNIFPKNETEQSSVYYKDNYFYALSWIINELDKLKQRGLFVTTLADAIEYTEKKNHEIAHNKACKILKEKEDCLTTILEQTHVLADEFYEKKIMKKLNKDLKRFYKA